MYHNWQWTELYNADKTIGHREFWAMIRVEVTAEEQASKPEQASPQSSEAEPKPQYGSVDIDSLTEAELDALTKPETEEVN